MYGMSLGLIRSQLAACLHCLHCTDAGAGRGLTARRHDDVIGFFIFSVPVFGCAQLGHRDRSASVQCASGHKSTSKFPLYLLTFADISA